MKNQKTQKLESKYSLGSDPVALKNLAKIEIPVSERRSDFDKMMLSATAFSILEAAAAGYRYACMRHDIDEDDPKYLDGADLRACFMDRDDGGRELERPMEFLQMSIKHILHEYPGLVLKGIIHPYCLIDIDSDEPQSEQWNRSKHIFCDDTVPMLNHALHSALVENKQGELITEQQYQEEMMDENIEKLAKQTGLSSKEIKDNCTVVRLKVDPGEDREQKVREYLKENFGIEPDSGYEITGNDIGAAVAIPDPFPKPQDFWPHYLEKGDKVRAMTTFSIIGKVSRSMLRRMRVMKFGKKDDE